MPPPVTASMLYDLVSCPHRVTMDVFTQADTKGVLFDIEWPRGARLAPAFHYLA